ncbi:MAG: hypothetical protein QOG77_1855 [Solirubrobacteraceae bacterium]|jgi:hypothetical protein|nr:hypothetical protein [Solirubrobacteraceae bacterium]
MGLVYSATAGFVVWIVLWSIGVKSIDAFMITVLVLLLAAGTRIVIPHLPGTERS